MDIGMTKDEERLLVKLLQKSTEHGFWFSEKVFRALHGVVSFWAPELVITRKNHQEILLTPYEGYFRTGYWHIPGGFSQRNETIQQSCSRIAKRELGLDVRMQKVLGACKWTAREHPYGRPLSLYILCRSREPIREHGRMKFFPVRNLPRKTMPPHRKFIEQYFGSPRS